VHAVTVAELMFHVDLYAGQLRVGAGIAKKKMIAEGKPDVHWFH